MATNGSTKRTDTNNATNAVRRRMERRANRGNGATADWDSCDSRMLQNLIATVTAFGGTITFGYTRDGGAYYVNYYVDLESIKEYVRPTENIDAWLEAEIEAWK